jgi:polysaccharide biosynthesis protein PelC
MQSHARPLLCVSLLLALLLVACSSTTTTIHGAAPLRDDAKWAILPVQNHSETPQAGERIESMLDTLLRKRGLKMLDRYPIAPADDTHLFTSERQRYETALAWARDARYDYAVAGSVEEWRYKAGLDAEPAIGVTVRVVDLRSGRVVWAGTGSKTGSGSENTSATALRLLDEMVRQIR